ncbi:putative RING finger protein [Aspergillus ibericus CBS 121593]|uniref:RING-type domain-containing protein n=1 Tax=Aspergillus ibericus CBS 121593 TaxID=1448316 RepID=A0A395HDT7_9EURO|nr:hypothetical protein BO80DRAFT_440739 [Aspergillus ibericus CBS 121593]RAL06012.1 hypothetical protein BO80DRAFT_440739 [Aspergillus ibericus CBS 121593]
MVSSSSAALLGYLAPACVAFLFFCAWVFIGARRRRRLRSYGYDDIETAQLGSCSATISQDAVNMRFPNVVYKKWYDQQQEVIVQDSLGSVESPPPPAAIAVSPSPASSTDRDEDTTHPDPNPDPQPSPHIDTPTHPEKLQNPTIQPQEQPPTPTPTNEDDPTIMCAICMEQYTPDDHIRVLTCQHIFHSKCLDPWFTQLRACCPLCKMSFCQERRSGLERLFSRRTRDAGVRVGEGGGGNGNARVVSVSVPEAAVASVGFVCCFSEYGLDAA